MNLSPNPAPQHRLSGHTLPKAHLPPHTKHLVNVKDDAGKHTLDLADEAAGVSILVHRLKQRYAPESVVARQDRHAQVNRRSGLIRDESTIANRLHLLKHVL